MTEQSGRFLIFLIDFIAFNIRLSKSSFAIASSMVSVVVLLIKGCLHHKTMFCHNLTLDVKLMIFLFEEKIMFRS